MTTYTRIVDGISVDVVVTPPSLDKRFNPEWLARQKFYVAPDGTISGRPAAIQPDGSIIWGANPQPPTPAIVYQILSSSGFQEVCETGLGGNSVGATRFGAIVRSMETSADDLVFSLFQRFQKSTTFEYAKSAKLFSVLVSKGIMTLQEKNNILNAWYTVQ